MTKFTFKNSFFLIFITNYFKLYKFLNSYRFLKSLLVTHLLRLREIIKFKIYRKTPLLKNIFIKKFINFIIFKRCF